MICLLSSITVVLLMQSLGVRVQDKKRELWLQLPHQLQLRGRERGVQPRAQQCPPLQTRGGPPPAELRGLHAGPLPPAHQVSHAEVQRSSLHFSFPGRFFLTGSTTFRGRSATTLGTWTSSTGRCLTARENHTT